MVLDDVDLLAAQLTNDGLHAHPFHPHASADRIHVLVLRHHCNLGTLSGFSRNRADYHRAVVDFRHFRLK